MRRNFKSETGSNNSDEQYDAMLILVVTNDKILFVLSVIVAMCVFDYEMTCYLRVIKIQKMLPHITSYLVIHTISYQYECAVYHTINNDQLDATSGGDDSNANTDGIADASLLIPPNEMELWLDKSDESTSSNKVSFWLSKANSANERYSCVPKHISNIKSRLKLYLVNEGIAAEKYLNYETVLLIKQTVGIKVNYLHTFEILSAITSLQIVCLFYLFNHYPNSEHVDAFGFYTNDNMRGINTNASWGDFHYSAPDTS